MKAQLSSFLYQLYTKPLLAFALVICALSASSQGLKCLQFKSQSIIVLDTLPVEQTSIKLNPKLPYTFDSESNAIILTEPVNADSLEICFRTISPELFKPYFKRDIRNYSRGRASRIENISNITIIPKEEIFSFTDFESYGAITRGVTFGNRQNLFVNSALNLQLDGQLSEDLYVSASITDQNVPYQPEGNTQQIRDFDNVFIKLYNDKFAVTAGDIVLENPVEESYFLKYYKNVQGLSLNYNYQLNEKWKARSSLNGSAAKGQFSSALLDPIEGVQGPYRLTGPNGERFIIVLANSERVFIDGQLLQRGFDRDYVIDYNLGEITFSNSVVVTRFTRIRVDFEYAEQYYSRSNLNLSQELWNDRTKFYFNIYQEKDNAGTTLGYALTENDIASLQLLGDNQGVGAIDGVEPTGFIEDAILYFKKDSIVENTTYSILVQSSDPELAEFTASYTDVGTGNYVLKSSTANGRIYEWVAPINGQLQGSYEPIRIVPLPNKKQMMVLGNSTKINHFETFNQELGLSNQDQNLYSKIDDQDNIGYAWRGSINSKGRSLGGYKISSNVSFEWVEDQFQWIDRFRSIEYDRNWGYSITQDTTNRTDKIFKTDVTIIKDQKNQLIYKYSYRDRNDVVKGYQSDLAFTKKLGSFLSKTSFYRMNNEPANLQAEWVRFSQDIKLDEWALNPGYKYELDQQKTRVGGTLSSSLMHYRLHNFYLESGDSLKTQIRVDFIKRYDQLPVDGSMQSYTEADEFRFGFNAYFLNSQSVSVTGNYRKVEDKQIDANDENLLGRLDWEGSFFDKKVKQKLSFSTANTRELKREFIYILVPTGEGTHTWRDENEDGIQDLNEFYEAINVDERNYAKIFTPTDEYINAFQSTFLHTLDIQLPRSWKSEGSLLKTLSKFSINTNTRLNYKSTDNSLLNRLNPFGQSLNNIDIISAQNQRRYSVFYNRNGSGLAFDLNRANNESKSLLTNGFEIRKRQGWTINTRFSVLQDFTFRFRGGIGLTSNESDFLDSRNFKLSRNTWAPELVWQPTNSFRFSGKVEVKNKNQKETEVKRNSAITDYSIESTLIKPGKGNLNAKIQWISIDFKGEQNTYLGYELLEGLQPGQNQKWNLNWQQSLNRGLQMTIQYNGRKSSGVRTIHTGTMQLTAFF